MEALQASNQLIPCSILPYLVLTAFPHVGNLHVALFFPLRFVCSTEHKHAHVCCETAYSVIMSLFITAGMNNVQSLELNEERLQLAEMELATLTDLYNSIVRSCKAKCFTKYYGEDELSKGENVCIDRCTAKFFQANILIGKHLGKRAVNPNAISGVAQLAENAITPHAR